MTGLRIAVVVLPALVVTAAVACSAPDVAARVETTLPDRAQFAPVHGVLLHRCGSLECHGTPYRNMRLFGYGGQRLAGTYDGGPEAGALFEGAPTPEFPDTSTDAETNASYESVVALEPGILGEVVRAAGAGAERLTLVRKGRGEEDHKGLQRYCRADSADRCITSWLAGAVDEAACVRARGDAPSPCAPP